MKLFDYECKTTFWDDFSIADCFGVVAIKDTYKRAVEGWKADIVYMTELAMVLNHKCWYWYGKNDKYCELYSDLYYSVHDYVLDHFKGNDLSYYLKITD